MGLNVTKLKCNACFLLHYFKVDEDYSAMSDEEMDGEEEEDIEEEEEEEEESPEKPVKKPAKNGAAAARKVRLLQGQLYQIKNVILLSRVISIQIVLV